MAWLIQDCVGSLRLNELNGLYGLNGLTDGPTSQSERTQTRSFPLASDMPTRLFFQGLEKDKIHARSCSHMHDLTSLEEAWKS